MVPSAHSLYVFEAAARNLNFGRAAAELNVTQPSVSNSIKVLERHLNVILFVRENRGVQLTESGQLLYESVRSGFQRIEHCIGGISVRDTQYITVAISTSLAAHWLAPKLPAFQQRHPGVKIRIVTTDRDIDPDHQVDMTIWLRSKKFKRSHCWILCDEVVFPVCSPSYLVNSGPINATEDLIEHRLIHSSDPHRKRMTWGEWLDELGHPFSDVEPELVFSDYQLAIQAALAGEGVALGWSLTTFLLRSNKLLIRPLMDEVKTENAFFVVANERSSKLPGLNELVEWLVDETRRH